MGRYNDAEGALRNALQIDPNDATAVHLRDEFFNRR
jgi:hypothetical protein